MLRFIFKFKGFQMILKDLNLSCNITKKKQKKGDFTRYL